MSSSRGLTNAEVVEFYDRLGAAQDRSGYYERATLADLIQHAALTAISVKGVPMDEVARRMGTNHNALYKMLHDARLRLKGRLRREGVRTEELLSMFGN